MELNDLKTFGDVRREIVATIIALRDDKIDVSRGMAMAANFKVLNDNVQVEINATKMALLAKNEAHNFGKIVDMGQRFIAGDKT